MKNTSSVHIRQSMEEPIRNINTYIFLPIFGPRGWFLVMKQSQYLFPGDEKYKFGSDPSKHGGAYKEHTCTHLFPYFGPRDWFLDMKPRQHFISKNQPLWPMWREMKSKNLVIFNVKQISDNAGYFS